MNVILVDIFGENPFFPTYNCSVWITKVVCHTKFLYYRSLVFLIWRILWYILKLSKLFAVHCIDMLFNLDMLVLIFSLFCQAITARGGVFLESPVVGSRVPALEGQLIILAAGERKLYDECYSCFEAIGKKSLYLGKALHISFRWILFIRVTFLCLYNFCSLNRSRHRGCH